MTKRLLNEINFYLGHTLNEELQAVDKKPTIEFLSDIKEYWIVVYVSGEKRYYNGIDIVKTPLKGDGFLEKKYAEKYIKKLKVLDRNINEGYKSLDLIYNEKTNTVSTKDGKYYTSEPDSKGYSYWMRTKDNIKMGNSGTDYIFVSKNLWSDQTKWYNDYADRLNKVISRYGIK